ncbi:MAG: SDR family NAD(P)-dependent oxidoreductase [Alphaproteobacteria bacterium]|nr:SDR family NAD(P)-dependent oxidoreductase [Alphaproteobacteria bacterium]
MVTLSMATTSTYAPCALITGAAKRVGREVALHLASRGYDIIVHYHSSANEAENLASEIRALGQRAHVIQGDLSHVDVVTKLFDDLPIGPVTLVVHNAARFIRDTIDSMKPDVLEEHFRVNVLSPLLLTQAFAKHLPPTLSGHVITLSDGMMGWSVSPQFFSYAASKLSWLPLTDLLAASLAPRIRMNTIALGATLPGVMDTENTFSNLAKVSPLKSTSSTEEVCRTVSYILDTASITGQIFYLSSGMHLSAERWMKAE